MNEATDINVTMPQDILLKSILNGESVHYTRTVKVGMERQTQDVTIGVEPPTQALEGDDALLSYLDRAGLLDQSRAEGFATGLFVATLMMALDDTMYPEVADVDESINP